MKFLVVLALAGLAMAEPEAAPQYPIRYGYSPQNYLGYGLHHSPVYNFPVVQKTVVKNAVAKPVVYTSTSSVNTPFLASPLLSSLYPKVFRTLNTPLVNTFGGLKTLTPAVVSSIAKREADPEADPQITTGLQYPVVYNTALHNKVYTNLGHTPVVQAVHTPLVKTLDHAVVLTSAGPVHSSHVGVCTNHVGIRVPC